MRHTTKNLAKRRKLQKIGNKLRQKAKALTRKLRRAAKSA